MNAPSRVPLHHRVVRRYQGTAPSGPAPEALDLTELTDGGRLLLRLIERVTGPLRSVEIERGSREYTLDPNGVICLTEWTGLDARGARHRGSLQVSVGGESPEPEVRVHMGAVVFRDLPDTRTRIEYSDSGRISATELMRMLEPTCGFVTGLRFRPAITGLPNTVAWEALGPDAEIVTGKLVLHGAVSGVEVVTWAEVMINER